MDQDTWDALVEAYRGDPGNHSRAARLAGVQWRTARRAYEVGYPERPWATKSIKQLLHEDAELGRARAQLEADRLEVEEERRVTDADRDREAARQHAARAKTEEAVLVSAARAAAMRGLAAAIEASGGLRAAMRKVGEELTMMSNEVKPLSAADRTFLVQTGRRFASILRDLASAGQVAMEMERLYLGEPTQVVGVKSVEDEATTEELVRMAGYADEVLRRAHERGVVTLPGVAPSSSSRGGEGSN